MLGLRLLAGNCSKLTTIRPSMGIFKLAVSATTQFSTKTRAPKNPDDRVLRLNDLQYMPGSRRKRIRWGRGTGSGRGKLCGFGHQKSRSTPMAFEGGQTPMYKRFPKIGFKKPNKKDIATLGLEKLQAWIDMERLTPKPNNFITMRDLLISGVISNVKEGVKLLANGKERFRTPIHLEVSYASKQAIEAVEAVGGTVTCVHFNKLAIRALIKPYKFEILPMRARPPPKLMNYYLDKSKAGYMSPEIQMRNLKLFGFNTSEPEMQLEHQNFMDFRRYELKLEREAQMKEGVIRPASIRKLF